MFIHSSIVWRGNIFTHTRLLYLQSRMELHRMCCIAHLSLFVLRDKLCYQKSVLIRVVERGCVRERAAFIKQYGFFWDTLYCVISEVFFFPFY